MEKRKLERALGMGGGYVLDFSNRTFAEFFFDGVGIDIYDEKYGYRGDSKANRMRAFWDKESNFLVGKMLGLIFDEWKEYSGSKTTSTAPEECLKIVWRLKESMPAPDLSNIISGNEDQSFNALARSVRESIEKNEPEAGLDRLHTFVVKYFRNLCEKNGITTSKEKPLHSLVGEYAKVLKRDGRIESEMSTRILKSMISTMEAFNTVRNDHSFAHDNNLLNYNESLLIFEHVTSSIRFIEAIESGKSKKPVFLESGNGELPF
ncbi:MAG: abortive infection family protein [Candidatus Omnitrophica bacterium]|nr:abortive infection family protein [Candidatus Omnitrophota bacterium]